MTRHSSVTLLDKTLAVVFTSYDPALTVSSIQLYAAFQQANDNCFWNLNIRQALSSCQLMGLIHPASLLIGGPSDQLEVIKLAWAQRLLKPPAYFALRAVGEFPSGLRARLITQQNQLSLNEALCHIIFELATTGSQSASDVRNQPDVIMDQGPRVLSRLAGKPSNRAREAKDRLNASWCYPTEERQVVTFDKVYSRLCGWFPGCKIPSRRLIKGVLDELITNGVVYRTEHGYRVMTPDKLHVAQWIMNQQLCLSAQFPTTTEKKPTTTKTNKRVAITTVLQDKSCERQQESNAVQNKHTCACSNEISAQALHSRCNPNVACQQVLGFENPLQDSCNSRCRVRKPNATAGRSRPTRAVDLVKQITRRVSRHQRKLSKGADCFCHDYGLLESEILPPNFHHSQQCRDQVAPVMNDREIQPIQETNSSQPTLTPNSLRQAKLDDNSRLVDDSRRNLTTRFTMGHTELSTGFQTDTLVFNEAMAVSSLDEANRLDLQESLLDSGQTAEIVNNRLQFNGVSCDTWTGVSRNHSVNRGLKKEWHAKAVRRKNSQQQRIQPTDQCQNVYPPTTEDTKILSTSMDFHKLKGNHTPTVDKRCSCDTREMPRSIHSVKLEPSEVNSHQQQHILLRDDEQHYEAQTIADEGKRFPIDQNEQRPITNSEDSKLDGDDFSIEVRMSRSENVRHQVIPLTTGKLTVQQSVSNVCTPTVCPNQTGDYIHPDLPLDRLVVTSCQQEEEQAVDYGETWMNIPPPTEFQTNRYDTGDHE